MASGAFVAENLGGGEDESCQEEDAHDDKGEDPLECNDLNSKLVNCESCGFIIAAISFMLSGGTDQGGGMYNLHAERIDSSNPM